MKQAKRKHPVYKSTCTSANMSSVKAPVALPIAAARLGTYTENTANTAVKEEVANTAVKTEMTEIKLEDQTNNNDSKSIVAPGVDLDKFQEEQKKIEEANKRRKELLSKAIADRYDDKGCREVNVYCF